MDIQIVGVRLPDDYTGFRPRHLGDYVGETFSRQLLDSDVVDYDPEMSGEALLLKAAFLFDGTLSVFCDVAANLLTMAERWAKWHGGEWVVGPAHTDCELNPGREMTWTSATGVCCIPLRRRSGPGFDTLPPTALAA